MGLGTNFNKLGRLEELNCYSKERPRSRSKPKPFRSTYYFLNQIQPLEVLDSLFAVSNRAHSKRMASRQAHGRTMCRGGPCRSPPLLCVGVGLAATVLVAATVLQNVMVACSAALTSYYYRMYHLGKKRRAGARRSSPRSTHAHPTQTSTPGMRGTVLRPLLPRPPLTSPPRPRPVLGASDLPVTHEAGGTTLPSRQARYLTTPAATNLCVAACLAANAAVVAMFRVNSEQGKTKRMVT